MSLVQFLHRPLSRHLSGLNKSKKIDTRLFIERSLIITILGLVAGCSGEQSPKDIPHQLRHSPPTNADVLEALLASARFELTDSSCRGAGTNSSDKTVGENISGWLIALDNPHAKNSIQIEKPTPERAFWKVKVMIYHEYQENNEEWGWGIEFNIRKSDGQVDSRSFRCLGAG